jgi:sugar lactone lactonase YvrE
MHRPGPRHAAFIAAFALLPCLAPAAARADVLLTKAGTGTAGAVGDGAMAAAAQLNGPRGLARLADGSILVADTAGNRVRRIAPDGTITTVAGTGVAGSVGDGGPAVLAQVNGPRDVTVAADGTTWFIAETGGNRIRRVDAGGTISTVAGNGVAAFAGDGGAATLASVNGPSGVATTASGTLLIADTTNNRIRQVTGGIIGTIAGNGTATSTGDGSNALLATINLPQDVAPLAAGGYLIADTGGNRVRRVDAGGTINVAAGTGVACAATTSLCGDYGPATLAQLNAPAAITTDATGTGYLIADTGDHRVRRVTADGTIATLAGSGTLCATSTALCGDAGPAGLASLSSPRAAIDLPDGTTLVADSGTNRLRLRVPGLVGPAGAPGPGGAGPTGPAGPAIAVAAPAAAAGVDGRDGSDGAPGPAARPAGAVLTAAFASSKLTGRAARANTLRIVLTGPAVVQVRLVRGQRTVVARRVTFRTAGRKQISVGRLKAATYAVTLTATDGATQSVDRAALRVLPGR